MRHGEIDPRKIKDDDYITEFAAKQFRIDPATYSLALLNAKNGSDFDSNEPDGDQVIFAGIPNETIEEMQVWD